MVSVTSFYNPLKKIFSKKEVKSISKNKSNNQSMQRISTSSRENNNEEVQRISTSSRENNNEEVQRISISSRENLEENNFNLNRERDALTRDALTLNNIKNNLPILHEIHKSRLVGSNFGTVYIYKNPEIYNLKNTINSSKIKDDDKILWEYYMLNNFLFTKDLFDKKIDKNSINSNIYSEVYPLVIYPFKESMEEFNTEIILSEKKEINEATLKFQNNKSLLEIKKKEKKEIESKLMELNETINKLEIKLKITKLTNNINALEKNITNRNKNLKYKKIMHARDIKKINLNKSVILLLKKENKHKKLEENLNIRIQPETEKSENRRLISELEKNIDELTIKKNKSEKNLEEIDIIISTFEEISLLNNKVKFIKKILDIIKLNNNINTKTLINIIKKLEEFKKELNFYAKEEISENNYNKQKIMSILSKKIENLNENSNNVYLISELKFLQTKLTDELKLIEAKIDEKTIFVNTFISNYNGGFVDPFSGTIMVILSFITMLYIHFLFIIKLFANYVLVACSKEMKDSSRTNVIKSFIRTNFKDLFLTYILVITFTAIGPLGIILNHVILFGITKFIASKSLNKGSKKITNISKSEKKFNKTLNFLCKKGKNDKNKGIINTVKNTLIEQVNSKKFQIKCIGLSIGSYIGLINNKDNSLNNKDNSLNNNEDLDLYRLILVSKKNNIYKFHIINLLNDTFYGYIKANADVVEKIYLTQSRGNSKITKAKESDILYSVNILSGRVNKYFHIFINFLREIYKPQKNK
jgi:hypothetical protein